MNNTHLLIVFISLLLAVILFIAFFPLTLYQIEMYGNTDRLMLGVLSLLILSLFLTRDLRSFLGISLFIIVYINMHIFDQDIRTTDFGKKIVAISKHIRKK
jgi:hypothetical protein